MLTYAAETRSESTKTNQQIETAEMRVLRKITNNTIRDMIRNENIRERCKVENISQWTRKRKMEWNQHIDRMDEKRLVKIARDEKPVGRRSVGRPRKRWKEGIW